MAGERLQARLDRPGPVPRDLLFVVERLPAVTRRRTEEDLRGGGDLLQRVQRPDTAIVRPWFLR